ncbi:hypothetical protein SEA_MAGRITTE_121 [Microbacterium phage Magritte]|nr:hypothetical protein SEA_MAGRITTE_121 [Microbacterium phage Magritte]
MAWNPSDKETFVYVHPGSGKRVVLLVPGGVQPVSLKLETELGGYERYTLDDEMTDQTRMHVRVSNRKRGLAD